MLVGATGTATTSLLRFRSRLAYSAARGRASGDTVIDDDDNAILDVGAGTIGPVELPAAIDFGKAGFVTASRSLPRTAHAQREQDVLSSRTPGGFRSDQVRRRKSGPARLA